MSILKICKFFSSRSNIPYTNLSDDMLEQQALSLLAPEDMDDLTMDPTLPPPFDQLKFKKNGESGQRTTMFMIGASMCLGGVIILMSEPEEAAKRKREKEEAERRQARKMERITTILIRMASEDYPPTPPRRLSI